MRNGIINKGSKLSDIAGVLTGSWYEYDRNGWHVVKTPFMLSMSGSFEKGTVEFPTVPDRFGLATWANNDGGGVMVVKPKQTNIVLPENAFIDVVIHGIEEKL